MLVSVKWLSEYVPITLPLDELLEKLTVAGLKVEHVRRLGADWQGIQVAHVEKVAPHPNADRLRLVTLDTGAPERPVVVCGAPNVAEGQKIAYAAVGARVRDGHSGEWTTLKQAKIRGVDSAGMVLSEKELGLSDQHEGILVLPEAAMVGQALADVLGDTIVEFEVTPNRPDLLSLLGTAWEVAAQTHVEVREPERVYAEAGTVSAAQKATVSINERRLCSRYMAGVVERLKVGPSPQWMQERLLSAGMRPINNIVDITNYVMLETGQPLHAFDLRKLAGQSIVVRRANPGEHLRTIDGNDRELKSEMLVIADANKAVAIAGVMGGGDSEVSESTTSVLLEAANFDAVSVRRTSTQLGLRTEASIRFEKGLHPDLANVAIRHAMKLLVEVAGGRAARGLIDVYPVKRADTRVVVTRKRIEQVLGVDLSTTVVRNALMELGFGCRWVPPDRFVVRAPYWRTDISFADDIVEEIARATGYDNIQPAHLIGAIPDPVSQPVQELRERLKDACAAAGLQEVISYPLTTVDVLKEVLPGGHLEVHPPLRLENPMSSEQAVMRTSLRASVLSTVAANLRRERGPIAVFESAHAYLTRPGDLPDEREIIVGVLSGSREGRWGEPLDEPFDFYDLKGILEDVFERCQLAVEFKVADDFSLLHGHTAALSAAGNRFGVIGQVHPRVAERFGVDKPAFLFELDVESLLTAVQGNVRHHPVSRFPAVIQDIALLLDATVPAAEVAKLIAENALVTQVQLFDVYEGSSLPEGKRSLAYAVHFQALDRTLIDAEVADARRRIVTRLERELGAELRGAS